MAVETPIQLTEQQRKLLCELDDSFKRGGDRHSPDAKSWTDRVKDLFKQSVRAGVKPALRRAA